ncbi:MAG: PIN domain-containing protein [Bifidobacteriaceae bacterium]|jgi:predicted nucleic acid-binding protein|nr:PIN domain-containing protein [Bifidobacteriaceae bacterium]
MIVDTSALLALFDRSDPHHAAVAAALGTRKAPRVISPFVLAELDYLVLTRHGRAAESAVLSELGSGAWELASMPVERVRQAVEVLHRFADQSIGLTDASLIVLAHEYRTRDILTLDRRHFSVLRFPDGSPPRLILDEM